MRAIDYQIQLQKAMQAYGLNLIHCNDCDTILIHTKYDEEVRCPSCLNNQHTNDCQDLYYEGCWSPDEDEQNKLITINNTTMNTNMLTRYKKTLPFSQRLNDFINKWFEEHQHIFTFTDVDDFDGDDLEGTLKRYQEVYKQEGIIKIWTGASDNTIFGTAEMNWKFRAWHDYIHITQGFGFDFAGESIVCQIQKEMIPSDWLYEKDLIHTEIIGQAQFFVHNGFFIDDQRRFTSVYMTWGVVEALKLTND